MATIEQIMQALETVLGSIDGLKTSDTTPGQVTPPVAYVGVPTIPDYHTTYGGRRLLCAPTITVLTSSAIDRAGQLALASYADPNSSTSIVKKLDDDPTLSGVVEACQVISFEPIGSEEVGVIGYTAGRFTLRVLA